MSRDQCEATLARGTRCHFAAKHLHYTQAGGYKLRLCQVHLRTILRRERLGSDADLVARWRER